MKQLPYLIIFAGILFTFLFPKASVYAEGNNIKVVEVIPAPTIELKVVDMVKPSESEFKIVEKVPAPSPTFTFTPIPEDPPLMLTPIKYLPKITPTISPSQYPVLTDSILNEPMPIFTNPIPIKLRPVLSSPIPIELPLPPSENPKFSKPLEELIALAKADLAQRLGINIEEISVQSIVKKTWSDASLGCPEKGKLYAQVITPGYLIILETGGKTYDYRASTSWVSFCSSLGETKHSNDDGLGNLQTDSTIERQTRTSSNNQSTIIGRLKIALAKFLSFGL